MKRVPAQTIVLLILATAKFGSSLKCYDNTDNGITKEKNECRYCRYFEKSFGSNKGNRNDMVQGCVPSAVTDEIVAKFRGVCVQKIKFDIKFKEVLRTLYNGFGDAANHISVLTRDIICKKDLCNKAPVYPRTKELDTVSKAKTVKAGSGLKCYSGAVSKNFKKQKFSVMNKCDQCLRMWILRKRYKQTHGWRQYLHCYNPTTQKDIRESLEAILGYKHDMKTDADVTLPPVLDPEHSCNQTDFHTLLPTLGNVAHNRTHFIHVETCNKDLCNRRVELSFVARSKMFDHIIYKGKRGKDAGTSQIQASFTFIILSALATKLNF